MREDNYTQFFTIVRLFSTPSNIYILALLKWLLPKECKDLNNFQPNDK